MKVFVLVRELREFDGFNVDVLGVFAMQDKAKSVMKKDVSIRTKDEWQIRINTDIAVQLIQGSDIINYTIIEKEVK